METAFCAHCYRAAIGRLCTGYRIPRRDRNGQVLSSRAVPPLDWQMARDVSVAVAGHIARYGTRAIPPITRTEVISAPMT